MMRMIMHTRMEIEDRYSYVHTKKDLWHLAEDKEG